MTELTVRNPFTEEQLGRFGNATPAQARETLARATECFRKWRHSPAWERSQLLLEVANELEKHQTEFIDLIRQEAGKPVTYAKTEVTRAIGVLRWAASETQRFSGELLRLDTTSTGRSGFGIHTKFPRGVILGITPFNFPLNLVLHKVAPAVACGCSIVIKPSPATPITALKLAELFHSRQPGLVQVLLADDSLTEELTRTPEVAMISFTGSARVGWLIRRQAPEKPSTLELGGNAWIVVMEDTPKELFPKIARRIANAAYGYAGQSCISVQNVAIAASAWKDLQESLAEATRSTPYGNPADADVISGPLIHAEATQRVRKQLTGVPKGATIISSITGRGEQNGKTIAPSFVLMPKGSDTHPLIQEEVFGPVMTGRQFESLDEVIQLLNSSRYGLQAGIYTQHYPTIERFYQEVEVGGVIVNDVPTTRYDHQPYGGIKESGQGREGIRYAMEEMTESKFLALSSIIQ